jgi:lipid-binding SYLF domain-containing protein
MVLIQKEQKMVTIRNSLRNFILLATVMCVLSALSMTANAATAEELKADATQALQALYKTDPFSETLSKTAKAILVFPHILKAGLVFGGSYGEGVLIKKGQFSSYYNSVSASWGWQAGAESYGYIVFLMTDKVVNYLAKSRGWEFGIGPSVVVVNEGVAKKLSSTTLKNDAYAYIFNQQGLMVNLSIEGTKISPIKR